MAHGIVNRALSYSSTGKENEHTAEAEKRYEDWVKSSEEHSSESESEPQRFDQEEAKSFDSSREGRRLAIAFACMALIYMWPYQTLVQAQNFMMESFPAQQSLGMVMMLFSTWPLLVTHTLLSLTGILRRIPYTCKVVSPLALNVVVVVGLMLVLILCKGQEEVQIYSLYIAALTLSTAESVVEPAIYDMAGLLPSSTATFGIQVGNGAGGVVVSFLQIGTRLVMNGLEPLKKEQVEGLTYFFLAVSAFTSLAGILLYLFFIRETNAYHHYVKLEGSSSRFSSEESLQDVEVEHVDGQPPANQPLSKPSVRSVLSGTCQAVKHVWCSALAVCLTLFVTLTLWPAIPGRACVADTGTLKEASTLQSWWFDLILFAYNFGDFVGKSEKYSLSWGARCLTPALQLLLAVVRTAVFVPLIFTASAPQLYSQETARLVLFAGVLLLGFSNGWLATVSFMRAPKAMPAGTPNLVAEQASTVLVIGLFVGIACGCLVSWWLGAHLLVDKVGICHSVAAESSH